MNHLNNKKCHDIFNRLDMLKYNLRNMKAFVQNPDFVTEEYVENNLKEFNLVYNKMLSELKDVKENVIEVYNELINCK